MLVNKYQKIALIAFIGFFLFWVSLYVFGVRDGFLGYLFGLFLGLIPFFSGILAMLKARIWGGFRSAIGKAVFFVGLGICLWGSGELIWSYYNFFLDIAVPYPSLADVGFAPSILFYSIGAVYLSTVTGVTYALKKPYAKPLTVAIITAVALFSYYVAIVLARGGVIITDTGSIFKIVLDIAYPLGDFIGLAISVLISGLSLGYLGGVYKYELICIFSGLALMFFADTMFTYTTTVGSYYNGSVTDLMLLIAMTLLSFGVLGFVVVKNTDTLESRK